MTSLSPCTLSVLPLTLGYIGQSLTYHSSFLYNVPRLFSFALSHVILIYELFGIVGAFGSGKSRAEVMTSLINYLVSCLLHDFARVV